MIAQVLKITVASDEDLRRDEDPAVARRRLAAVAVRSGGGSISPRRTSRERLERSLRDLQTDCIDIVQLHTWTRAWNRDPSPLETLRKFQKEGKLRAIGISTPEHDQNSLIDLMRGGWLDSVQVIYNIFEQEPAAEFLPAAKEHNVGVIVRVAFDESALTGKLHRRNEVRRGRFPQQLLRRRPPGAGGRSAWKKCGKRSAAEPRPRRPPR